MERVRWTFSFAMGSFYLVTTYGLDFDIKDEVRIQSIQMISKKSA